MSTGLLVALVVGGVLLAGVGFKLLMMLVVALRGDRGPDDGFVLRTTLGDTDRPAPDDDFQSAPARAALVGRAGVAITDLRPAGKARIDGRLEDVVSVTDYVEAGEAVVVVEVEGVRVVVERRADRA